jgi:Fe-S cluster assembly scaffold protein SufB
MLSSLISLLFLRWRVQLAKAFSYSSSLLPDPALVKQWCSLSMLNSLRQQAYEHYCTKYGVHDDKELSRFIPAFMDWPEQLPEYTATPYQKLPSGVWIADFATLDEPKVHSFMYYVTTDSSLLASLVCSSYTTAVVLFIPASSGEQMVISLDTLLPSSSLELLYIIVEPGAQVTLQEHTYQSTLARMIYGFILPGARVTFLRKQEHRGMYEDLWILSDNASLVYYETLVGAGSLTARTYQLNGDYARVHYTMLSALKGDEHALMLSKQYHTGKHTESSVRVKTALWDTARAFYRGIIDIEAEASYSQADQYQAALMLSSDARVCAIPSLEVKAHEVQCRHGSAAGHIQDDQRWYLLSRGLDPSQAEKCIIEGFFNDALPREYAPLLLPSIKEL